MAAKIYYFTGSGNSLAAAKELRQELSCSEIKAVKDAVSGKETDAVAETLILVFPAYFLNPPIIIGDFLRNLQVPPTTKIYAVATYGGMLCGCLKMLSKQLKQKGLILSGGFKLKMPDNYAPAYDAFPEDKQKKLFDSQKKRTKEIAQIISAGKNHKIEGSFGLIDSLISRMAKRFIVTKFKTNDKNFSADDKCIKCGACEKICPVKNIKLEEGKPVWLHNCEQCFACYHWCPASAIQYGKKTLNKKRYHHPEIKLSEL